MKPIRIPPYCLSRIEARQVDRERVEHVIRAPEQVVPDKDDPGRQIHQSRFVDAKGREKLLRVVVEEHADEIVAVTV
jgi:hypothetical protein